MARGGKKSLAELVDPSEIIDLGEELNAPNLIIDDNYGISGKYADYALVQKKIAHRTGTKDDGINEGKVIRYIKWEDVSYNKTIFDVLRSYCDVVSLSKIKTLEKCKDFSIIENIYKDIRNTINDLVSNLHLSQNVEQSCNLKDTINKLNSELREVQNILSEADELRDLIKEKKKLIMKS